MAGVKKGVKRGEAGRSARGRPRKPGRGVAALLAEVLCEITPEEDSLSWVRGFLAELRKRLHPLGVEVMLGGSSAKGTFLRGDYDVDVFVRFPLRRYATKEDSLSDLLGERLPSDAERVHGSRDYFQLSRNGFLIEIVPVLKIRSPAEARNVTDVSPLHVAYVLKHLRANPSLVGEIRLAKQFCKAARVYGAESHIRGFSGHSLDLLLIYYQGFLKLLRAAARWQSPVIIDPARHHKDPLFSLNESKHGPLILVDPVQPERNAAAAVSLERLDRFRKAAAAFLEEPSRSFFTITPLSVQSIKEEYAGWRRERWPGRKTLLFILESEPLSGKEDVVATKLFKVNEWIVRRAREEELPLLDHSFEFSRGKGLHYFVFSNERLSPRRRVRGPPLSEAEGVVRFRRKHRRVTEEGGRLYAEVARAFRSPRPFLEAVLAEGYVRERARSFRLHEER